MIPGLDAAQLSLLTAVFVASIVEFVEAFTIVLAMGMTRSWRSAVAGTLVAIVALTVTTALAGYALVRWFPESLLQLIIGTLLLIFGLQWLRKAILRSAGLKALHDEEAIFAAEAQKGRRVSKEAFFGVDWFAFVVTLKGVYLEGLEVVFIVLTFGLSAGNIPLAAAGSAVAGALVLVVGVVAHRPLSRVPENTLKFGVGILMSTFGTFWALEGLDVFSTESETFTWPGGELALVGVLFAWVMVSAWLVRTLRSRASSTTVVAI